MINIDIINKYYEYWGVGEWSDFDILYLGNRGMTTNEYRSHYSLCVISEAPLLLEWDFINMTNDTWDIVTNEQVIAINQNKLWGQGRKIIIKNFQFPSNYIPYKRIYFNHEDSHFQKTS